MVWKFSSWTMKTKMSLAFKTGSARAVMGGWGANWLNSVKIFYFFCGTFSSFASTWFSSLWLHQPRHCPNKIQGIKSDTLSVLGASPLKKPAAPSSFAITLKQSIIPLYDWTLPKFSLAWWKPCTFKKGGAPLILIITTFFMYGTVAMTVRKNYQMNGSYASLWVYSVS